VAAETPAPRVADSVGTSLAWIDFVGGQAAWWGCVLLVRAGREHAALIGPALYVATHAVLRVGLRTRVLALAGIAALTGWAADTALVRAGLLAFPAAAESPCSRPWMAGLWAAFAVSLTASLAWLVRRPIVLAAALGALAGPAAYAAGERLGALALGPWSSAAVAAEWAVSTTLLVLCARRVLDVGGAAGATR
jgi:hypothetical protein